MADYQTTQGAGPGGRGAAVASMANWAGALVSLVLIIGVAIWGYRLLVRDVTGVPVVRAAEGPMRVAPDDPGGAPADHQGLAVNRVAGIGAAEPVPDRLVLAPAPVELDDSAPVDVARAEQDTPDADAEADTARQIARLLSEAEAGESQPADRMAALADALAGDAEPLSDLQPVAAVVPVRPAPTETAGTAETPAIAEDPAARRLREAPGVKVSLRPAPRPAGLRPAPAQVAAAPAAAAGTVQDIDPGSIPAGTRLVQLGAYESPEIARAEWIKLDGRFDAFLDGKSRVIQRATSGGRTFYRLRAHGFADLSDARRFCAALVAGNADCIPVVTR